MIKKFLSMRKLNIAIGISMMIAGIVLIALDAKASTLDQVPPISSDPDAYREITTDNGVVVDQLEYFDDGTGTIIYQHYDGTTTETRDANAFEIAIYNQKANESKRIEWANNFADELDLCSSEMFVAEADWSGWGANARDTAIIETFRCLGEAYNKHAKVVRALTRVLVNNGIDITQ